MGQEWSMRAYREGDEDGILELWKATYPEREYNREGWLRWWHWKYKENPAGPGRIWLAEHDGRIVGQKPIVPVLMKIGTKIVTAFQNIDTMTHPDHRRQGIYESLSRKTVAEAEKDGIHIGYTFPSKVTHPILVKRLGWFDVAISRIVFKPLNWQNTLTTRIDNRFLLNICARGGNLVSRVFCRTGEAQVMAGATINQVYSFDERINDFWNRVSDQHEIMVVRNKDYLNWRYVAVPSSKYLMHVVEKDEQIYGYLVLRYAQQESTKVAVIFDILAESEQIARCLISKATERCKQEGIDVVYSSMIANQAYLKAFKRNGFISVPLLKGRWFCAFSSSPHISKAFLGNPKSWFVQIGDSDSI